MGRSKDGPSFLRSGWGQVDSMDAVNKIESGGENGGGDAVTRFPAPRRQEGPQY
jgi:hypothetical protein